MRIHEVMFQVKNEGNYSSFLTVHVENAETEEEAIVDAVNHIEFAFNIKSDNLILVSTQKLIY